MTDPIVSVEWLAARLQDPQIVVVDATLPPVGITPVVDTYARYLAEHLPGAVFFDIEALSDHNTTLPHMLPSEETFAENMSALGISDAMTIVVYEQESVFSAPRAWWMLRTMGAQQVFVLDGGLRAWKAAGHPIESGPVQRPRAAFEAVQNADAVRDFAHLQQALANHAQVLDARSAARFAGSAPEPRAGLRSGHMPGATSLPFTEVVADGRLKTSEDLRQVFAARGINLQQPVTTTCGSGVTAAVLALALERCGASQVSLYDGSWAEYAQRPEAVIATDK
jgi:thiosulfate/3-mercaptopyruvate sulfurtransferase